jgi:unsaturated rhamnogalacturonyl hydrolase
MKKLKVLFFVVFFIIQTVQAQNVSNLSVLLAESQMQRENSMTKWKYYNGFFMYSLYKVYERTNNPEYFNFIKDWADKAMVGFSENGKEFNTLDDMYPALVLMHLYEETGEEKYMRLSKKVINTLKGYPRTKEGGYLHMVRHDGQLWLDGIYMINVFLAKYGEITGDTSYYEEVIKQISVYTDLLRDEETGLLYHAYVEGEAPQYFDPDTKHSNEFWGRSMGWVMMAAVEVLDIIPEDYKRRKEIIKRLQRLSDALLKYQDPETGLWYQVTNRADLERNWLESSSTAMFTYGLSKGVRLGVLDKSYMAPALKAYQGMVKHKIFIDEEGLYTVKDICHGTVVGDLDYYLNRPPSDNNLRGLPSVILMSEELREQPVVIDTISQEDHKRRKIEKRSAKESRYNVLNFGVNPDGKVINTHKIQILVELLHKSGGGTIYFPSGKYLTGSLMLKDGVYLELSHNAIIIGSPNKSDYLNNMPLISAKKSRNMGIVGQGTINGNGEAFEKNEKRPFNRSQNFIQFENCSNIKISGITIIDSPNWNLNFLNCDYVWIDSVSILSYANSHKEGIDTTFSSHVYINNCYFGKP